MFTQELSRFIEKTNYSHLSPDAVTAAKKGITDYLGVALAGSREQIAECVEAFIRANTCGSESTVIGSGARVNCSLAAWANGVKGHALDFDDCIHIASLRLGHPTTTILPAVLAVAEKLKVSGREVMAAYCLGVEVFAKIGLLFGQTAYFQGWHNTALFGTMGAAAAAGKLMNLDESQLKRCFGIAASMAGGIRRNFGTMIKPVHAGNAARNGVEAAMLAEKGFTSWESVVESPMGFFCVFSGQDQIPSAEKMNELISFLGNPWSIVSPGLVVKLYPSCRATHSGVDALFQINQQNPIDWTKVSKVECNVPKRLESLLLYHKPTKGLEGKFSLEYCIARYLIDGKLSIDDFTDARVNESSAKQLIDKIEWISNESDEIPEAQEFTITLEDGSVYRRKVKFPKGEPQNPVGDEELYAKYQDCASKRLSDELALQLKNAIQDLEKIEDISQIAGLYGRDPVDDG